ncbi:hypothetical protein SDC9_45169 [bioreactor metagenome]|uniref:Uncharacterized protein n=1 Tax=bioreactor metagenome TaxID=1076179 RepID=A0A644W5U8_9ZZZZ
MRPLVRPDLRHARLEVGPGGEVGAFVAQVGGDRGDLRIGKRVAEGGHHHPGRALGRGHPVEDHMDQVRRIVEPGGGVDAQLGPFGDDAFGVVVAGGAGGGVKPFALIGAPGGIGAAGGQACLHRGARGGVGLGRADDVAQIDADRRQVACRQLAQAGMHHRRHRARGDAVIDTGPGREVAGEVRGRPRHRRGVRGGQRGRAPGIDRRAGKARALLLGADLVARRVAGTAMGDALDQIGAAVPLGRFRRIVGVAAEVDEEQLPARLQDPLVQREGERRRLRRFLHRGDLGHQIGIDRVDIGIGHLGEMVEGEGREQVAALAVDALVHGTAERGLRPIANPRFRVGRDIRGVDGAEIGGHREVAGIGRAARCGVACGAIARGGEDASLFHLGRVEGRAGRGRLDGIGRVIRVDPEAGEGENAGTCQNGERGFKHQGINPWSL